MPLDPSIERDLIWKRSWPRCFLGLAATIEVLLGLVIFLTEIFNILMDFWHTNIFGGIWASILIFFNWLLIYSSVCCTATICSATYAFIWNIITLIGLGVLIVFDIIFILNPYTCILTPSCSSQPMFLSLNSIMQLIAPFKNFTSYDSKKFFLQIQVGCAGVAFIISLIYIFIFIACKIKIRDRTVRNHSLHPTAPPPSAPPIQYDMSPTKAIQIPWSTQAPYTPY